MYGVNVLWFRHGLRLHDNPALLEALKSSRQSNGRITLLPMFIFDGESAGTKSVGYNRMRFLLDSLRDLDAQLQSLPHATGRLLLCTGNPAAIFRCLHQHIHLQRICFEQDCEPIWHGRDGAVRQLCDELGIECVEKVSHTLWDPRQVIATNGGIPPLTYQMFLHTVQILGLPPRPVADPNWQHVSFVKHADFLAIKGLNALSNFPTPEHFNIYPDNMGYVAKQKWVGGERQALLLLEHRLRVEEAAFQRGRYLPNQAYPNIVESPKSMSAHLRFGCLSVRRFYWCVHDLHKCVQEAADGDGSGGGGGGSRCQQISPGGTHITGQLIWREYFYTMSVYNPNYDRMEGNEICLNIPWAPANDQHLALWRMGRTGFPLIDASMRQLLSEGWLHHTLRNIVATFLTRGALWQSWEHGLQHFLHHLLDADWSVCAGNWMWVSSSAFEHLLDSSLVTCPVALSKRLDPNGDYIRHYVSELAGVPREYVHEPWRMPTEMQEGIECVIGVHYPQRMIDLTNATMRNMHAMKMLRQALMAEGENDIPTPHIRPSNEQEIRHFFWLE